MNLMRILVIVTGMAHFFNIPATLVAPKILGWKDDFSKLSPINRMIVFVLGVGMQLTIVGLGIVTIFSSDDLLQGGKLQLFFIGFMCVFWLYRALVQFIIYPKIWPSKIRLMHYGLQCLLTFLTCSYGVIFIYAYLKNQGGG